MFEQIAHWPFWAQFTLMILVTVGSAGGIGSAVLAYLQSKELTHQKQIANKATKDMVDAQARLEVVETNQIKVQSDADIAKAASENTARIIEGWFKSEERWQKNYDVNSERQQEIHKGYINALHEHATILQGVKEVFEIQSTAHAKVTATVERIGTDVKAATQTIRDVTEDNRKDFTALLGKNVQQQADNDKTLRDIYQAIHGLRTDVTDIISRREDHRNQTLQGIEAKFKSIEQDLSALMNPRPVLLPHVVGGEPLRTPVPRQTSVETLLDDTPIVSADALPQVETTNNPISGG